MTAEDSKLSKKQKFEETDLYQLLVALMYGVNLSMVLLIAFSLFMLALTSAPVPVESAATIESRSATASATPGTER